MRRRTKALMCMFLLTFCGAPGRAGAEPMTVLLVMEGWQRNVEPSGVVAYACRSAGCPKGSEVSYKPQPHRPTLGRAQFEAHHMRLSRTAPDASQGRILRAAVHDFEERQVEGVRVLSVRRDVEWADGHRAASVDALLIGPSASMSVVSDAADEAAAAAGFAHFLPRLVDLVLVNP